MTKTKKILLPVAAIGVGAVIMFALIATRADAERVKSTTPAMPVEMMSPQLVERRAAIVAQGRVVPARLITLEAEIAGRAVKISPKLRPGGRFYRNDWVVKIDDRDYWFAVQQALARVEQARVGLEIEKGRKAVAEREWRLLRSGEVGDNRGRSLALREPQLRQAQAALEAAESSLESARLSVERTTLRAPFNAVVTERRVDVGQIVRPGAPLATLVGTDTFWIEAAVPQSELSWIDVPGAAAHVMLDMGGLSEVRQGRVIEAMSDVEKVGLMARLLIEVADPLGVDDNSPTRLLLGASVDVTIDGHEVKNVYELPREALRIDDMLWTVRLGRLSITQVDVVRKMADRVLVRVDLGDGEAVITSALAAPVVGMAVEPRYSDTTADTMRTVR